MQDLTPQLPFLRFRPEQPEPTAPADIQRLPSPPLRRGRGDSSWNPLVRGCSPASLPMGSRVLPFTGCHLPSGCEGRRWWLGLARHSPVQSSPLAAASRRAAAAAAANCLAAELHSWLELSQRAQPAPRSSIPPTGAQEA